MKLQVATPLLLLAAAFSLPAVGGDEAGFDATALFAARCASCHSVPYPGVRTDRVWLGQVRETT